MTYDPVFPSFLPPLSIEQDGTAIIESDSEYQCGDIVFDGTPDDAADWVRAELAD